MTPFAKKCLAAMASVALLPVPAQAETAREIDGYLDDIYKYDVKWFNDCVRKQELSRSCGDNAAARIICDYQAIMIVADESGLARRYNVEVARLASLIGKNADYIQELIDRGHMEDTAKLNTSGMRRYCRSISSAVFP
ncbi:hypothetical protein EB810_13790 [Altererythrobacter sp. FM1]|uniref:hypothetical protein n=1 Tax=Tsuneonella flava TaxID=2055955 RepID=UPI000C7FB35A|nr:hypothetical protein [Tsuneonella flava]ROT94137.1 hypothetical protein EB810_13790 [Altererythrobacter sp. FM1]